MAVYGFVSQAPFLSEAMMRLSRLLVGLTVLSLMPTSDVWACSCSSSGPPCQAVFQVDVVFAGTVRSVVPLPEDGPPLRPGEMRIRERFESSSTPWCRSAASKVRTRLCLQRVAALRVATTSNRESG